MPVVPPPNPPSFLEILIQLSDHLVQLVYSIRPLLLQLQNNPHIFKFIQWAQDIFGTLPESFGLAVAVSIIFFSTMLVFKMGRTLISLIVALIQFALVLFVAFIAWKLRDPLSEWIEYFLAQ